MGVYVNPRNTAFEMSRFSPIYVDKSMLISKVNALYKTEKRFLCVSRPRRFGKSMAANMLSAYYSRGCHSETLFQGLKIEKDPSFCRHLNQHNVIRLDIQQFIRSEKNLDTFISEIEQTLMEELTESFPDCAKPSMNNQLNIVLNKISAQTGEGFIFIIDEWDCVFRIAKKRSDIQKNYLDFLRGLFKGTDYTELVYMTGILPIKKYGEHSAVNIFDEYSMINPKHLGEYFGFTVEEVRRQCEEQNVDYNEMERWYDGYQLEDISIYNPKSVVDALTWKEFQSYWTGTETYEALKIYIDLNFDGLKEAIIEMLGNGRCKIDPTTFQNDMTTFKRKDDVLTLLIHLGYLTYDKKRNEVFIPNQEISHEFIRSVETGGWDGVVQSLAQSEELLHHTWALDGEAVAECMDKIHSETASILKYNNENSLTCAIFMAYYSAKTYYMNPIMELPTGKGYADVVYLPKRNADYPAMVVELKWNQSAKGAIHQIKEKQYASWISGYTGKILLVGISYNKEKKHECVIEAYEKR